MSLLRIAHLSDPHFGTTRLDVVDGLLNILKKIEPTLILLTGDITQRARANQFKAAKDFIDQLEPATVIAVPGNHDISLGNIYARIFHPYKGYKNIFKQKLEQHIVLEDLCITCLNSTSRWRHIQGDFQNSYLEKQFQENYSYCKVRIVAFHHPMDCAKHVDDKNLLKSRNHAIALFERHKVDMIVSGHIHDPYVSLSEDRYPHIQRKMILSVAGTCLSSRTRAGAPNSFNLIEINTDLIPSITLTRFDMDLWFHFSPKETHRFSRDPNLSWDREPSSQAGNLTEHPRGND
ncbi:metallophosphoesterase family protein [Nitrosomonas communis]|uniref:3',5'-cyclic AMP phosphodiesterase CpdA n=1 Tax=Nitrosomonas communis TaxID=44574 RepID=A0A1H2QBG9_9PROT|nr:metallophosphoesterase [Nitrosomonas communis]SDW04597.1 3',5'-cyclic AMP phosphodiesterase CpdA [Nitrosomonas communis]